MLNIRAWWLWLNILYIRHCWIYCEALLLISPVKFSLVNLFSEFLILLWKKFWVLLHCWIYCKSLLLWNLFSEFFCTNVPVVKRRACIMKYCCFIVISQIKLSFIHIPIKTCEILLLYCYFSNKTFFDSYIYWNFWNIFALLLFLK